MTQRFLKEFATYQKNQILHDELMKENYKEEKIKAIEKAISLADRGMVTINEAIKAINEA